MAEMMTLERIKPTHWMDDLGRVCTAEFMASEKAHGDYQLAYRIPCVKQGRKFVRIDDTHLTQPAQAVDVGAVHTVIAVLCAGINLPLDVREKLADKLTRAIGNACALPDEWREFVERVSKQRPSKPDYWSSCDQCERNSSDAEDLLAATQHPTQRAEGDRVTHV